MEAVRYKLEWIHASRFIAALCKVLVTALVCLVLEIAFAAITTYMKSKKLFKGIIK